MADAEQPQEQPPQEQPQELSPDGKFLSTDSLELAALGKSSSSSASLKKTDEVRDLGAALDRLRRASTRHNDVERMKQDVIKEDLAEALDEPEVNTRADLRKWQDWAKKRAELEIDYKHPRRKVEGATGLDRLQQIPILCDSDELMQVVARID